MMRIWALALAVSGVAAWGQVIQAPGAPATGPYTDTASGVVFPVSAGAFQRNRMTRGADLSASYIHDAQERVAATVILTHDDVMIGSCDRVFDKDRAIGAKRSGVVFDLVPPAVAGWGALGFATNGTGASGSQEHYYYCADGWVIQFSFQHSGDVEAEALETAFLAGFPLPEKH